MQGVAGVPPLPENQQHKRLVYGEPRPARAGLCTSRTSAESNFGDDITGNEPVTRTRAGSSMHRSDRSLEGDGKFEMDGFPAGVAAG